MTHENNYDKIAREIVSLIKNGKTPSSPDQTEALRDFIEHHPQGGRLRDELCETSLYRRHDSDPNLYAHKLIADLKHRKNRRTTFTTVSIVAAAVVAVLCIRLFAPHPNSETHDTQILAKPLLITASGERIELQSNDLTVSEQTPQSTQETATRSSLNRIIIPAQTVFNLTLADGTSVTLNAGSSLEYPTQFDNKSRRVRLSGEGFFDVVRSETPFEVALGDNIVKVYGTKFNADYRNCEYTRVVLVEGSVGFIQPQHETQLKPGQLCDFSETSGQTTITNVNINSYTGWLKGQFDYDNITVSEFLEKLALWYGVEFQCNNPAIENKRICMSVSRQTGITEILAMLENMTGCQFKINGTTITLKNTLPMPKN